MVKIICKLFLLASLAISLCIIAARLPIRNRSDLSLMANKFEILRSKSKNKKIVFVGGSGLHTGLDSRMIAKKLRYDVVNLGLYAIYGIPFILNETKKSLNKGDIVVLVPEYGLFYSQHWWTCDPNVVKSLLLFASPHSIIQIYGNNSNYKNIIKYSSELIIDKLETVCAALLANNINSSKGIGKINSANIIDSYGDCKNNWGKRKPCNKFMNYTTLLSTKYDDTSKVANLNSFSNWCNENGIQFFLAPSAFPHYTYNINEKAINNLYNHLKNHSNYKILCDPKIMSFESKFFWDSADHLDPMGKIMRTEILLQYLSTHVAVNP